ncbi:cytochrome P450 [Pullulanibacillus pueri]|uniref:Cytochrome P450 n=1 Tax=Pullulanibacillus pueri TaxID=1437324 RepID=A0A8J2ZY52_9BACL|nr:cytochrome P450 [Pullulanibacillus pueri]MBM7683865.1 cytochrome P450 [Pullulanibacillus pueri]GGH84602.1 cytochrome P450 [Pullulanibacillus pueri]
MVDQKETLAGLNIDLFSETFNRNPYPVFQQLRERDPIHQMTLPDGQTAWVISRYDDAMAALKEVHFIKDPTQFFNKEGEAENPNQAKSLLFNNHMLNSDPPAHRRLRNLVQKAFTPRMIAGLRPRIEEITTLLLDDIEEKGAVDLIEAFAFPLPIIVICEMLGVPSEDRDIFRQWSNTLVEAANNPKKIQEIQPQMINFSNYIDDWIHYRKQHPQHDLISHLIEAEERGEQLNHQEIRSLVFLLIIAGHETTVNLIGNGVLALLENPDQLETLKANPSLIHQAIEEMLRYNGPVEFSTSRWASEDIVFRGQTMSKGDLILIALDSANRDPEQFQSPETFDITRKYNRHLAFGKGIHYCLGAPLARLEGEIAINALIKRMPNLQLNTDSESLQWRPGILIRGLTALPVRY